MFGGERQPARTGTGARRISWVWSVRLSLFFVRPASSQLHFPGSQHRFPISFQINLPGPFSPRRNGLSTFCQHTRKEHPTSCPSLCCPRGTNQTHHHSTDKTSNMSPVPSPFCKGQSHPCHRQVREKKGGTGARWCCWAGGRICSRYPAPGRGGAVHCRRKRTGFAQLSAFCFSPLPHSDGRDAWEAPTSSALPAAAAAPFCGGLHQHPSSAQCCVTRRRHHVCLLPTAYWPPSLCHWTLAGWTLDIEWLGGHGHGLEAEFCHPLSPLSCRFSRADPVGQQNGIEIGLGRPVSDPPTAMTQRIGSGPITMSLSLGTESRGRGGSQTCRAPSSTSLVFRTSRMALPERTRVGPDGRPDQADGVDFETTWRRAVRSRAGSGRLTLQTAR